MQFIQQLFWFYHSWE